MHRDVKRFQPRGIRQFFLERLHSGKKEPHPAFKAQNREVTRVLFGIFIGNTLPTLMPSNEPLGGVQRPFKGPAVDSDNRKTGARVSIQCPWSPLQKE